MYFLNTKWTSYIILTTSRNLDTLDLDVICFTSGPGYRGARNGLEYFKGIFKESSHYLLKKCQLS
jgi:hypothetical protein